MKTIEQTRRELFEAQMEAMNKSPGEWRGNHYSNPYGNSAWFGFNAALDAVEIELPEKVGEDNGGCIHDSSIYDEAVDDCRAAIESTNLGIKVK